MHLALQKWIFGFWQINVRSSFLADDVCRCAHDICLAYLLLLLIDFFRFVLGPYSNNIDKSSDLTRRLTLSESLLRITSIRKINKTPITESMSEDP